MPKREDFFKEPVKPIEVKDGRSISALLDAMSDTSFQGRKLGEAFRAWDAMLRDKDTTVMLGLTGSLSTAGMWKIMGYMIDREYIDLMLSTGANISEDIYNGMGFVYGKGTPWVDDQVLLEQKIDRYYDEWADEYKYREMEELLADFIQGLDRGYIYSTAEFLHLLGRRLDEQGIDSMVTRAYRSSMPIFSPAMVDSSYGIAAVYAARGKGRVVVDQFKDFEQMTEVVEKCDETAVVYIGGGVPKDTIQLTAVMKALLLERKTKKEVVKPHKYAIQITSDSPQWGGLSGATFEEAISWGKTSPDGNNAICYCDSTIALPLIAHALNERGIKRKRQDLSFLFKGIAKFMKK
ncbi:MAG: deoxyhypusine synthase [Nitrososphaerota archaeon]|nr:deoxyhypusine synthase [Nitrososphaerota archaeon]